MPKGEDMAAILARHCQTEQWQREGGQFIPHLATWINQGRWQDDVGIAITAQAKSTEELEAQRERQRLIEKYSENKSANVIAYKQTG